jgi:hypothetical protein
MPAAQALQLVVELAIQGLDLGWGEEDGNPGREGGPEEFLAGGREEPVGNQKAGWLQLIEQAVRREKRKSG